MELKPTVLDRKVNETCTNAVKFSEVNIQYFTETELNDLNAQIKNCKTAKTENGVTTLIRDQGVLIIRIIKRESKNIKELASELVNHPLITEDQKKDVRATFETEPDPDPEDDVADLTPQKRDYSTITEINLSQNLLQKIKTDLDKRQSEKKQADDQLISAVKKKATTYLTNPLLDAQTKSDLSKKINTTTSLTAARDLEEDLITLDLVIENRRKENIIESAQKIVAHTELNTNELTKLNHLINTAFTLKAVIKLEAYVSELLPLIESRKNQKITSHALGVIDNHAIKLDEKTLLNNLLAKAYVAEEFENLRNEADRIAALFSSRNADNETKLRIEAEQQRRKNTLTADAQEHYNELLKNYNDLSPTEKKPLLTELLMRINPANLSSNSDLITRIFPKTEAESEDYYNYTLLALKSAMNGQKADYPADFLAPLIKSILPILTDISQLEAVLRTSQDQAVKVIKLNNNMPIEAVITTSADVSKVWIPLPNHPNHQSVLYLCFNKPIANAQPTIKTARLDSRSFWPTLLSTAEDTALSNIFAKINQNIDSN